PILRDFFTRNITNAKNALDEWQRSLNEEGEREESTLPQKNLMRNNEDNKGSKYRETLNKSTLTVEDMEEATKPLQGEELRVQKQIIEACKRFKMKDGGIQYKLELPFKKVVNVTIEGKDLFIEVNGIYDDEDNPYYMPFKMGRSEGITRLVNRLGDKYIKLYIDFITVYEINVYKETTDREGETGYSKGEDPK